MATVKEQREHAIERVMRELRMTREDAESFVDVSEGRLFDLDDSPPFDPEVARREIEAERRKK
jgi:hypothetical protein